VGGQHHAPAALPPGNIPYPLYRRLGGPQGRSGRVWKISPPPGFFLHVLYIHSHLYKGHYHSCRMCAIRLWIHKTTFRHTLWVPRTNNIVFDPRTVQPVVSRYTDWATRPTCPWDRKWNVTYCNSQHLVSLKNISFFYHTTNVTGIFLQVFTKYQLEFLILAKRFADDYDIPFSSRYLRNIGPFFSYLSLLLPQFDSTLWAYCASCKMATGYFPRGQSGWFMALTTFPI
jgi:hypothetical protein